MKLITAETAGFCFGVKRAVETVEKVIAESSGAVYTYGPLIHNEEVVRDLAERGVNVINSVEELDDLERGTIVLRSHGVAREEAQMMKEKGFKVVDAACPFVKRIHSLVAEYTEKGYDVVIIGDAGHPEVEAIRSYGDKDHFFVIGSKEEAEAFLVRQNTLIAAQTTANTRKFKDLVEIIRKLEYDGMGFDIVVVNTICSATEERQKEAEEIAKTADLMIVIGGAGSSNTKKLVEVSKAVCPNTIYVRTYRDLNVQRVRNCEVIGITAGASTPTNIIEEVQKHVRNEF